MNPLNKIMNLHNEIEDLKGKIENEVLEVKKEIQKIASSTLSEKAEVTLSYNYDKKNPSIECLITITDEIVFTDIISFKEKLNLNSEEIIISSKDNTTILNIGFTWIKSKINT